MLSQRLLFWYVLSENYLSNVKLRKPKREKELYKSLFYVAVYGKNAFLENTCDVLFCLLARRYEKNLYIVVCRSRTSLKGRYKTGCKKSNVPLSRVCGSAAS